MDGGLRPVSLTRLIAALSAPALLWLPAHAEWVLNAYIGGAHTADTSLHLQVPQSVTDLKIHPVSYAAKPFRSPFYYGYRTSYFFTRHLAFEGEFTHLKVYAETDRSVLLTGILWGLPVTETVPLAAFVQRFNITHGVNLVLTNFVARKTSRSGPDWPFGRFLLSGRIGAGITIPHAENEILGVPNREHYQIGSPAIQLAGGFEMALCKNLYAATELKYTRINERVDLAQGTAASLLNSTHATAGLAWHF